MSNPDEQGFVSWFRHASPYIHAHRGRTFVIAFGGEAVADAGFPTLVQDLALLHGLGIRLVLVHGTRPQIEERLALRQAELRYENGVRVTDLAALECVKEAAGAVRVEIEALFSMGLADSPMAGASLRIASGNFVTAKPVGILDGVDHGHTGAVRRVDADALRERLAAGAIVLLPPIGYSRTGEIFNLYGADVAGAVAAALGADKLIFLAEGAGLVDEGGSAISNLSPRRADELQDRADLPAQLRRMLRNAATACRSGVKRVHLLARGRDGVLLNELFTRDGAGTLISSDAYEQTRGATIDDVPGILALIEPLEQAGVLVRRSRELLETEIERFQVMERDGLVVACGALYAYPEEGMAELACIAVHDDYRNGGRGDEILRDLEQVAARQGLGRVFVLTTQTAHWFRERGFQPEPIESLPETKRAFYNFKRGSKLFVKNL